MRLCVSVSVGHALLPIVNKFEINVLITKAEQRIINM